MKTKSSEVSPSCVGPGSGPRRRGRRGGTQTVHLRDELRVSREGGPGAGLMEGRLAGLWGQMRQGRGRKR